MIQAAHCAHKANAIGQLWPSVACSILWFALCDAATVFFALILTQTGFQDSDWALRLRQLSSSPSAIS